MASEKKKDSAYSKGALKLMVTAERLFGEYGIDNVSLRQIVTAAGQANSFAIQHHFGNKKGLIQSVYDMRVPVLDSGRMARLETAKDKFGNATVSQLLAALFMPVVEDLSETAQRSYALFNSRLMHVEVGEHPFVLSKVQQPATEEINVRLKAHFSYLPDEVFRLRLRLASELFLAGLVERRHLSTTRNNPYPTPAPFWNELLQAAEAILRVPYTAG
ncbi:MAG: TetR/AcrR family transcriptional regulator [Verrucomicrobiaceae bacterium]|nr:TetR/AcrR family transcriptional regulator [Verrucomicrobiaceae bacterium]